MISSKPVLVLTRNTRLNGPEIGSTKAACLKNLLRSQVWPELRLILEHQFALAVALGQWGCQCERSSTLGLNHRPFCVFQRTLCFAVFSGAL